jgi:hypothetical protein
MDGHKTVFTHFRIFIIALKSQAKMGSADDNLFRVVSFKIYWNQTRKKY